MTTKAADAQDLEPWGLLEAGTVLRSTCARSTPHALRTGR